MNPAVKLLELEVDEILDRGYIIIGKRKKKWK